LESVTEVDGCKEPAAELPARLPLASGPMLRPGGAEQQLTPRSINPADF